MAEDTKESLEQAPAEEQNEQVEAAQEEEIAEAPAAKESDKKGEKQKPVQPISKKKAKAARRAAAAEAAAKEAEAAKDPKEKKAEEKAVKKAAKKAKRKTRLSRTALIVLVIIGCAAMLISVTSLACSGVISQQTSGVDYTLTGGTAATVNGAKISEDTITKQIMNVRESYGYDSDEDWAQYLVDSDLTPESYRESLINSYARQYLIEVAESENGVSVSDEEIEEAYKEAWSAYGDEDTFLSMISLYGYDEDSYKNNLESSLAQDKLKDIVAPDDEVTDDDILSYLNENLDTYNDARRSSHILIKVASDATDEEKEEAKKKAQECLDKINSGELTWDEAVAEYSEDASVDDGGEGKKGNVGYDKLSSFVDEYQTALSGLSKGEISDVVESTYGYHIIKCTNYWHVDGSVESLDDVPKSIKEYIQNILESQNSGVNFSAWLDDYVANADIVINDMPENVPYNVSLDGVEKSSSDTSSTDSTTTDDTSDEVSGETTTDSSDASSDDTSTASSESLAEATSVE